MRASTFLLGCCITAIGASRQSDLIHEIAAGSVKGVPDSKPSLHERDDPIAYISSNL
jgi:hypothetical protein